MIDTIFKENNIKKTIQRIEIYNTVLNSDKPLTIKQINLLLKNKINIVTIYRIIELFVNKKIFLVSLNDDGTKSYSVVSKLNHKHYMNCIKCHKHITIDICPINNSINNNGCKIVSHNVQINVICSECLNHK